MARCTLAFLALVVASGEPDVAQCSDGDSFCRPVSGVDESALVQKDMRVRSHVGDQSILQASKGSGSETTEEKRIARHMQAAATMSKLLGAVSSTLTHFYLEHGVTYAKRVEELMGPDSELGVEGDNLQRIVNQAQKIVHPIAYVSPTQVAPMVETMTTYFDATNVVKAITDAKDRLNMASVGGASGLGKAVSKDIQNSLLLQLAEVQTSTQAGTSQVQLSTVQDKMSKIEKGIQAVKRRIDTQIIDHSDDLNAKMNKAIWNLEDQISMFQHDMDEMETLGQALEMDKRVMQIFVTFRSESKKMSLITKDVHVQLTKAGEDILGSTVLTKTNTAMDKAAQTVYLLSPKEDPKYSKLFGKTQKGDDTLKMSLTKDNY